MGHITHLTPAADAAGTYRKAKRFVERALFEKVDILEGIRGQRIIENVVLRNLYKA